MNFSTTRPKDHIQNMATVSSGVCNEVNVGEKLQTADADRLNSSVHNHYQHHISPGAEKAVVRKLDFRVPTLLGALCEFLYGL